MSKYTLSLGTSNINAYSYSKKGDLGNFYAPLQNLNKPSGMGDFTTSKLNYDYQTPVEIELVDEYDGSENIIINNDKKFPTLINSRFSVQENNTYLIPEHSGNSATNIYNEDSLNIESSLLKLYDKIPILTFNGITQGGAFKCGSYVFYFKYSDSDNNLSNIVQESGIVQIHIGEPGTSKVRMGLEDESADKNISFTLTNVDKGFDYIRVFYERTSSGQSQASTTSYYMVNQNFPIINSVCKVVLTGNEDTVQITKADLETEFADIQSAKTSAINSNILFLGNTTAYEQKYQELQQIAWMIYPKAITVDDQIGQLTETYEFNNTTGCYYDVKNVYNYTGYWPDEYYRFGVVFIYNNNQCSNVYNIQGVDLNTKPTYKSFLDSNGNPYENEPENYIFNNNYMTNSRGVVRMPQQDILTYSSGNFSPSVMGIQFDLTHVCDLYNQLTRGTKKVDSLQELLKLYNIKGLFFVRQKRIPSIYAQGIVVGLTGKDFGCLPVIYNEPQQCYVTKSFLSKDKLLLDEGTTIGVTSDVKNKALFVPDSELQEATYNQIFTGQEFALQKIYSTTSTYNNDHYYINDCSKDTSKEAISKVTAVQKDVKLLTDGETYFSTLAGDPSSPEKTKDVNLEWDKTKPQYLSNSTSVVRGKWGYFVGLSSDAFDYGDIVNIKNKGFVKNSNEQNLLEFQKRFNDSSFYSSISPRVNVDDVQEQIDCFRGDCFPSLFTHKVMNNFIDPELPTNTKIINPSCWADNYLVRCTAKIVKSATSNLLPEDDGFYLDVESKSTKNKIVQWVMVILTGGMASPPVIDKSVSEEDQNKFANEICTAFEIDAEWMYGNLPKTLPAVTKDEKNILQKAIKEGKIRKLKPSTTESSSGINIKALFTPSDKWEMRGISSINRADVNAVSFAQWLTFPICSSMNLAFRDIDYSQASEEASLNKKRSFYPWDAMDVYSHQFESNAISHGAKKSIASIQKVAYQTIPFIKQEFFNRIYWSRPNAAQTFVNSYRMIFSSQFREYPKEYGSITKLVSLGNSLFVIFQHGIMLLPVNTTPQSENESSPYLAFKSVLQTNGIVISDMYGSMWKDSVIKSEGRNLVYGVDTVAKKIWRASDQGMELISDHKVQKFLNDYLKLSEFDYQEYLGHVNVKTHYNAFKKDVMFTFYKDIPIEYALTQEQENVILDDFKEGKLYYNGPVTESNLMSGMIIKDSEVLTKKDDTLTLTYKRTAGAPQKIIFKIENYGIRKQVGYLTYHPELDTNFQIFYKILQNNILKKCIYQKATNTLLIGDESYQNVFTWNIPSELQFTGIITAAPASDTSTDIVYYYPITCVENAIEEYSIRKGQVYSKVTNKPVTPISPIKWKKGLTWSLCYNENTQCFQTFYDWTPLQSENIDNIYFSFDKDVIENILNYKEQKNENFRLIEAVIEQIDSNESKEEAQENTKVCDIKKSIVDRSFSNNVKEYLRVENSKSFKWVYDIPYKQVLCFYTNADSDNITWAYKGNVENDPLTLIKFSDYNNYKGFIIYRKESVDSIKQVTITVTCSNELNIIDPHLTPINERVTKGDFNYYEYRDTNIGTMKLWKHGQAGLYDNQGKIKPTNWYGKQHEFNFEFIVNSTPEMQKIFNNLMIISNKTAPKKFEYEVVGEGYDWYIYKTVIGWINQHKDDLFQGSLDDAYKCVLTTPYKTLRDNYEDYPELFNFDDAAIITKLPYLQLQLTDQDGLFYDSDKDLSYWVNKQPNNTTKENNYSLNSSETCLIEDDQLSEYKLHTESLANDMKKYGRVRGNMEYLEDLWKVEIRPVNFRYAYWNEDSKQLLFTNYQEMRHRDKFLRIKIRYDGKDLALIQTIATFFDYSYA